MTSMRDIQPEAFEFEPEFSFGKFDSRPAKRGVYETELELEDEYPEEPFPLPRSTLRAFLIRLQPKPFLPDLLRHFHPVRLSKTISLN